MKSGFTCRLRNCSRMEISSSPDAPNMKAGSTAGIEQPAHAVSAPRSSRPFSAAMIDFIDAASRNEVTP